MNRIGQICADFQNATTQLIPHPSTTLDNITLGLRHSPLRSGCCRKSLSILLNLSVEIRFIRKIRVPFLSNL